MHRDVAPEFLPGGLADLRAAGVELRVDGRTRALARGAADSLLDATEDDYATEFLALTLAVRVVDSADEAIEHVNRFGSGHSEAIVTSSTVPRAPSTGGSMLPPSTSTPPPGSPTAAGSASAPRSATRSEAPCSWPIGLRELCTFDFVVEGAGHTRP